jgi:segregation and condensation protein B
LEREARLSSAALEVLAVIAYRQPVTRAEVEAVRGVDCAGVLATLHGRELIEAVGRLETVGHPIQYGTTPSFLRHFGLRSLAELPPLGDVEGKDAGVLLEAALLAEEVTVGPNGSEAASE